MIMRSEITNFDKRLTEKMTELGISQADLCRLTGLASSMVSHYCTGQRMPSIPAALKIARVLNTTVDYLAFGNKPPPESTDPNAVSETRVKYASKRLSPERIEDEQTLIGMFRLLSMDGQAKVCEYVEDLLSTGRY
jgi:transcriptional regulator with XRE-family HTH domain